jgi:hypothetical protein
MTWCNVIKTKKGFHISDFYGSAKQNYSKTSFKASVGSRGLDKLGKFLNGEKLLNTDVVNLGSLKINIRSRKTLHQGSTANGPSKLP